MQRRARARQDAKQKLTVSNVSFFGSAWLFRCKRSGTHDLGAAFLLPPPTVEELRSIITQGTQATDDGRIHRKT
jgi:hypothetical protein